MTGNIISIKMMHAEKRPMGVTGLLDDAIHLSCERHFTILWPHPDLVAGLLSTLPRD
jgi:hypothetical protein